MRFAPTWFVFSAAVALFFATRDAGAAEGAFELNRQLIEAATKGDVAVVEALLRRGADPNVKSPREDSWRYALQAAVGENHLDVVRLLLDHGADPRPEGSSVLELSTDRKHEAVARLLLSRGLKIDEPGDDGRPHLMGKFGNTQSGPDDVAFLLELGADPNARAADGVTPLMSAASRSVAESDEQRTAQQLELLLKAGARVNDRDDTGRTALHYAVENGQMVAIRVLVAAGADVNARTNEGISPLLWALQRSGDDADDARVDYLISNGADVKARSNDGVTSLMVAITAGNGKRAKLMLKKGVDPNARTKNGQTAAHLAAAYTDPSRDHDRRARNHALELLDWLATAGGDLTVVDTNGETPLHSAIIGGYVESAALLLQRGCAPNKKNSMSGTPLFLSVVADLDAFEKTELLLAKGADVNSGGPEGRTALMAAAEMMSRGHLMYLLRKGADPDLTDAKGETALSLAAATCGYRAVKPRDYTAVVGALARVASRVDVRDERGMTPLMWAAVANVPEVVTSLLDRGAEIDGRSADGRTALMWASSAKATDAIGCLLARGADDQLQDKKGRTALDWAKLLDPAAVSLTAAADTPRR